MWGHRLTAGDGDSPPNLPLCVCGEWLLHSAGDARAPCSRERTLPVGPAWLGRPKMSSMRPRPPFWGHTMLGCQTCKCHLLVPPCYTPPVTHLWASVYLSLKRAGGTCRWNDVEVISSSWLREPKSCQPFSLDPVCPASVAGVVSSLSGRALCRQGCAQLREHSSPFSIESTGTFWTHRSVDASSSIPGLTGAVRSPELSSLETREGGGARQPAVPSPRLSAPSSVPSGIQ